MRKVYFSLFLISVFTACYAQDYYQAVGLRGGVTSGITYKKFLNEMKAMEAILSFKRGGVQLTAVREYHDLTLYKFSDNFYLMKGYGGHVGFYYDEPRSFLKFRFFDENERMFAPVIGLDAYVGLEYRPDQLPVVLGIDYKPFFEFSFVPFSLNLWDTAFYIKLIL